MAIHPSRNTIEGVLVEGGSNRTRSRGTVRPNDDQTNEKGIERGRDTHMHELVSPDGVSDGPTWTAEYGFVPRMEEALGGVTGCYRNI